MSQTDQNPVTPGTTAAHAAPATIGGTPTTAPSTADRAPASDREVTRIFSRSVVISGIRCTLAYVIFPWILPLFGVAASVGPWVGLVIGTVAIGFNVASIRRFWASKHRWRWYISALNLSVIVLLLILLVEDLQEILG